MEVLASQSEGSFWEVTVGFTSTRTRTWKLTGAPYPCISDKIALVNSHFDPGNTSQQLENAASAFNSTGPSVPLKEAACEGKNRLFGSRNRNCHWAYMVIDSRKSTRDISIHCDNCNDPAKRAWQDVPWHIKVNEGE